MAVSDRRRLEMVERFSEVLGTEVTDTLLDCLPPADERPASAAQVEGVDARIERVDGRIAQLDDRMDRVEGRMDRIEGRMDRIEERFDRLESDMHREFREVRRDLLRVTGAQFFALVATVAAIVGLT